MDGAAEAVVGVGATRAVGAVSGVAFLGEAGAGVGSFAIGVAGAFVSASLRNHCTGLAHLPGVTRCHSERLAELLPSSVSSAVGVVLPSAALGDGAAGTASSVGF